MDDETSDPGVLLASIAYTSTPNESFKCDFVCSMKMFDARGRVEEYFGNLC